MNSKAGSCRRHDRATVSTAAAASPRNERIQYWWYFDSLGLLSRRTDTSEDLSYKFFCHIADPASCLHSLLPRLHRRLSPQGLDPLKSFLKFTFARSSTAPSYNMALITTSIKSNKSSFPTTPYLQRLASLFPISIAVVPLYSAYLCVCVCVSMFLSVCCYYYFFLIVVFTYSAL